MSTRRGESWAAPLGRAVEALERGHLRAATREAWSAGISAAGSDDGSGLEAVRDFAGRLREGADGRVRDDAEALGVYCSAALARARDPAGHGSRSPLARLLLRETPRPTKACPDCAETVMADARRCRHCGLVFPPPAR